jgi:hypothetical protein
MSKNENFFAKGLTSLLGNDKMPMQIKLGKEE